MAAVGLQRREAEDALKLTGGDVAAALAHQLGRLRLNTPALDCLVWEYATARWVTVVARGGDGAKGAAWYYEWVRQAVAVGSSTAMRQQAVPGIRHAAVCFFILDLRQLLVLVF